MSPRDREFSFADLEKVTGSKLIGDGSLIASGVNSLAEATDKDVSFLANPRYIDAMKRSKAGLICIDSQSPRLEGKNFLISDDPSRSFQIIAELLSPQNSPSSFSGIHPTAVIGENVMIGDDIAIGPYTVIDRGARIGRGTKIGPHVSIGTDVVVGENCEIHPFSVLAKGVILGSRVVIQSGAIIGSTGFGYTTDKSGRHIRLEQIGTVVIEDDVEIGANTTIDRARFKTTRIGHGTKIDNLVQIAHNVEVGPGNLIAAQSVLAGSVKTGGHVMMGGQVGVVGHVELDDQVLLATRSGVSKNLKKGAYRGSPAIPVSEYNRQEVHIRRLKDYAKRLEDLEKKLAHLS